MIEALKRNAYYHEKAANWMETKHPGMFSVHVERHRIQARMCQSLLDYTDSLPLTQSLALLFIGHKTCA